MLFNHLQSTQNITWVENAKLEWKDFKGQPHTEAREWAASYIGTAMKSSGKGENAVLTIVAQFNPDSAWVKKGKETAYLLNHEQLHFDIQEIFARKLKKTILNSHFIRQSIRADLDVIVKKNNDEKSAYQNLYDSETQHSLNTQKQNEWGDKIRTELVSLNDFKDPVINIIIK